MLKPSLQLRLSQQLTMTPQLQQAIRLLQLPIMALQERIEQEMEHQREVHDSLITRGLGVISDSYHDSAVPVCEQAGVDYRRLSPEGKNYRRIVEAASSGDHPTMTFT